jgi:hypothetical protein
MVTRLHSSVGQEQGRHDTQHFIPIRVYKCGIMERKTNRDKLGAVVVVQNCACEAESEGVESL